MYHNNNMGNSGREIIQKATNIAAFSSKLFIYTAGQKI